MSAEPFTRVDHDEPTRIVATASSTAVTFVVSTPMIAIALTLADADADALAAWLVARRDARVEPPPPSAPLEVEDARPSSKRLRRSDGQTFDRVICKTTGKITYTTRADAGSAIAFFMGGNVRRRAGQGKTRRTMQLYVCPFCKGLHVGTPSGAR